MFIADNTLLALPPSPSSPTPSSLAPLCHLPGKLSTCLFTTPLACSGNAPPAYLEIVSTTVCNVLIASSFSASIDAPSAERREGGVDGDSSSERSAVRESITFSSVLLAEKRMRRQYLIDFLESAESEVARPVDV